MIKKRFRLKGEDIKNFFNYRFKKNETEYFLIYYQKNKLNFPRFAVIPKKEIFKKAIQRNKIKRKIYGIIRNLLKDGGLKPYDFLIFPLTTKVNSLETNLIENLKKIQ